MPPMNALDAHDAHHALPPTSRLRQWAIRTWDDRDHWLEAPGGIDAVFRAAQVLGRRSEALDWLSHRTRAVRSA